MTLSLAGTLTVALVSLTTAQTSTPAADWHLSADGVRARIADIAAWQHQVLGSRPTGRSLAQWIRARAEYAHRQQPPSWLQRDGWVVEGPQGAFRLGVGRVARMGNRSLALNTAENRARAQLSRLGGEGAAQAILRGVEIIDWYQSANGELYVLAAQAVLAAAR